MLFNLHSKYNLIYILKGGQYMKYIDKDMIKAAKEAAKEADKAKTTTTTEMTNKDATETTPFIQFWLDELAKYKNQK